MTPARLRGVLRAFRLAIIAALAGFSLLAAAILVAGARYGDCGPSTLQASLETCRLGARLLLGAYAVLSVALVLGATSLSLLWRDRRRHRRPGG